MSFRAYRMAKRARELGDKVARRLRLSNRQTFQPIMPEVIPKNLWLYWDQGLDAAPEIVRACVATWQERNPDWTVRVLDDASRHDFVELPDLPDTIGIAHKADVLRTVLLKQRGGVWADATSWCLTPLSDWLPYYAHAGFFVFSWIPGDKAMIQPGPRRDVTNWFIVGAPGNSLLEAWHDQTLAYWKDRSAADHYFWHHEALEYVGRSKDAAGLVWQRVPKIGAVAAHFAWLHFERGLPKEQALRAITDSGIPLQKLGWRMSKPDADILAFMNDVERHRGSTDGIGQRAKDS